MAGTTRGSSSLLSVQSGGARGVFRLHEDICSDFQLKQMWTFGGPGGVGALSLPASWIWSPDFGHDLALVSSAGR